MELYIDKYKAHIVAKFFIQVPVIDFDETFSLVIKPRTICLILSLTVSFSWPLK